MKAPKIAGILSFIAAAVLIIAGIAVWTMVGTQLKEERITIGADSEFMGGAFAGKEVSGPLTAYAQADLIRQHSTAGAEGTPYEGKTYAELGGMVREARDAGNDELAQELQDRRDSVMNASFLRASLFTSVVAYGVCALVIGLGVMFAIIGWALVSIPAGARRADVVDDRVTA